MLVEIDRHVLSKILENNKEIDESMAKMELCHRKIYGLHQKNLALLSHVISRIREVDTGIGSEKTIVIEKV